MVKKKEVPQGFDLTDYCNRIDTIIKVPAVKLSTQKVSPEKCEEEKAKIEAMVEERIESLIEALGPGEKFLDPDFGPSDSDKYGGKSMYTGGRRPGRAYVDPRDTRWDRAAYAKQEDEEQKGDEAVATEEEYDDMKEPEEPTFCDEGCLFDASAGSNDVCQGKLGDCWLLGAMSVLALRDDLLKSVFWKLEKWRDYGLYVLRFTKDCDWYYVVIDDRLPVYPNAKIAKPVFAHARNKNELWVPLLEKAYAKLHRTYDALVGGYVDGGLKDMTGLISESLVLRAGHLGYHPSNGQDILPGPNGEDPRLWTKLDKYLNEWGCMMGCSIQPHPKRAHHSAAGHQAGKGLYMRHAYALLDVGEITTTEDKKVKLLRLRNPWGLGEWTGKWSDNSPEYKENEDAIQQAFSAPIKRDGKGPAKAVKNDTEIVASDKDGIFFMQWDDFLHYFTHLFAAVDFPSEYSGQRIYGEWTDETAGGNTKLPTWDNNPKYRFRVHEDHTHVLISLSQDDPRLAYGRNYAKMQDPIGFHICPLVDGKCVEVEAEDFVPGSNPPEKQPAYKFHHSNDIDVELMKGDYVLVPSTYKTGKTGKFFFSVYANKPFYLENGVVVLEEYDGHESFGEKPEEWVKPLKPTKEEMEMKIKISDARALIVGLAKKHDIPLQSIIDDFEQDADDELDFKEFQINLIEAGFDEDDFPPHNNDILNAFTTIAGDTMDKEEFMEIFALAAKEEAMMKIREIGGDPSTEVGTSSGPAPNEEMALLNLRMELKEFVKKETYDNAKERLTRENIEMARELHNMRKEMQHMAGILLLYGKMFGCYNQPMPANILNPESIPFKLKVGPPGMQGEVDDIQALIDQAKELGGDEFMAVVPWKGQVYPPTKKPKTDGSPPDADLSLEWVYGYAAQNANARSNIAYNTDGKALYHVAATSIIQDIDNNTQEYNRGDHNDDIMSFCISDDGCFCATGQMGSPAYIVIWNAKTGEKVGELQRKCKRDEAFKRGVPALGFNKDGTKLVAVGDDNDHHVYLFEQGDDGWANGKLVGKPVKGSKGMCLLAGFSGDGTIVTGGKKNCFVWNNFEKKKKEKLKGSGSHTYTSFCRTDDSFFVGELKGHVQSPEMKGKMKKIHEKQVSSLCAVNGGEKIVSGAMDGIVKLWTKNFGSELKAFDINKITFTNCGSDGRFGGFKGIYPVRAVFMNPDRRPGKILVGTKASEIIEIDTEAINGKMICQGHCSDELWAVATHPTNKDIICTGGDDKTVRVWDLENHVQKAIIDIGDLCRAVDWEPIEGSQIAAGHGGAVGRKTKKAMGGFSTIDVSIEGDDIEMKVSESCPKTADKWVSAIRFSPDGKRLAVGGHDNKVRLYNTKKPLSKQNKRRSKRKAGRTKAMCKKSSSYITNLDFSTNGHILQTNDGASELIFYDTKKGKQITKTKGSMIVDEKWDTFTCTYGWSSKGIWPSGAKGTDINAACRSSNFSVIATADDSSSVKLFRYPCVQDGAKCKTFAGHASHVTCCRFTKGDRYLITTGGNDRSVFQWKVHFE